jgi:hypothetical protein
MTRKEFIIIALNKKIKPLVNLAVLLYSIYFLIQVIIYNKSDERSLFIFIIFTISILFLLTILHFAINYLTQKIPEKVKLFFEKISNITEVISGIFLIIMLINALKENKILEFILILGITLFLIYTKKTKLTK